MPKSFDLVVIGGGVVGSFHAYHAAMRGLRTALIERSEFPRDASVRNFGTLVPSAMPPGEWHRRGLESVQTYRELSERLPLAFSNGGTVYPATTALESQVLREFAEIGPSLGYRCEWMGRQELAELLPVIRRDTVQCGLHFPEDARIEPRGLFREFIPWMQRELNLCYLPKTVATGVDSSSLGIVVSRSNGESIHAEKAIVCCGADLRTLFPERLERAGVGACKLQMFRVASLPGVRMATTLASGLTLRRYKSFQLCPSWRKLTEEAAGPGVLENGIHILAVQDKDGSFVVGDSHEYSTGEFDDRYRSDVEELVLTETRRLIELPDWSIRERWHGIYAMMNAAEIFCEEAASNVFITTAIAGKGMTTAPALAREAIDAMFGLDCKR